MENDSDYEQVFVINENDEPSSINVNITEREYDGFQGNGNSAEDVSNYTSSAVTVLGIFVVISLFAISSAFLFSNFINLGKYETYQLGFVASLCLILVFLLFLGCRTTVQPEHSTAGCERTQVRRERLRPQKKKKFNSVQEYRASQQFLRDKAEADANKTDEQKKNEERSKDIDVAVKTLISLGFKIKRATHLVSLALDSGISHKETQMLVKYALSNNNKV